MYLLGYTLLTAVNPVTPRYSPQNRSQHRNSSSNSALVGFRQACSCTCCSPRLSDEILLLDSSLGRARAWYTPLSWGQVARRFDADHSTDRPRSMYLLLLSNILILLKVNHICHSKDTIIGSEFRVLTEQNWCPLRFFSCRYEKFWGSSNFFPRITL